MLFLYSVAVKEEIRSNSHSQYLGCLAFICQVLHQMRMPNGDPFLILFKPALASLTMLLGCFVVLSLGENITSFVRKSYFGFLINILTIDILKLFIYSEGGDKK